VKKPLYKVPCYDDLTAADLVGRHLIGLNGIYWQEIESWAKVLLLFICLKTLIKIIMIILGDIYKQSLIGFIQVWGSYTSSK